jgi:integrase
MSAYSSDLERFSEFAGERGDIPDTDGIRHYLDTLYKAGLSNRSIGRHLTTLRNFYGFLLREGRIATDPTEHLRTPRQWQTIPKYLNLEQIERIIRAPDLSRHTGLRDRAMMELLYATGLRVSELCKVGVGDLDLSYGVVSSDSRTIEPGSLFVALRGPNFDGTDFAAAAAARGAVAPAGTRSLRLAAAVSPARRSGSSWPDTAGKRAFSRPDAPCASPQLRHSSPGGRGGPAKRAGDAGAPISRPPKSTLT